MSNLSLKERLHDTFIRASNTVSKTSSTSTFLTSGRLTPEEFVIAGDLLVHKCGSWSWSGCDPSRTVKYLPADKQFLIMSSVTCNPPPKANLNPTVVEDNWLVLVPDEPPEEEVGVPAESSYDEDDATDEDEEVVDAEVFTGEDNLLDDMDLVVPVDESQKTRTYTITICYNQYYQVPHVWLFGYDKDGLPLQPEQVYEDVSEDHRGQTVTIKPHPHLDLPYASIHPCRHASLMKKIIESMKQMGKEPRIDLYLFIFLKFLSAVTPNIEYDNTFDTDISLYPNIEALKKV